LNFKIGFQPGMAVDFCAKLQWLTRCVWPFGAGVQHRAAITQPGHTGTVEQMGIDARDLRRGVGTQTQGAPRELVNEFEGLKIERPPRARKQRFEVLQQRRHDQLVAEATRGVKIKTTEFFDMPGLGRQNIGDVIRQDPSRHEMRGAVKKEILPGLWGRSHQPSHHKIKTPVNTSAKPKNRI
jgi:hypothetical protein